MRHALTKNKNRYVFQADLADAWQKFKKGKMTAQPQEKNKMTPREYLTRERSSFDIKHEFFNGEIFAMVGAGRNHNRINVNLTRELGNDFKANQFACDLFSNDMRVKIEDSYAYPDIVIFCGDAKFEDVVNLVNEVKKAVKEKSGIELKEEIIIVK